jgi:hypothetical protein
MATSQEGGGNTGNAFGSIYAIVFCTILIAVFFMCMKGNARDNSNDTDLHMNHERRQAILDANTIKRREELKISSENRRALFKQNELKYNGKS